METKSIILLIFFLFTAGNSLFAADFNDEATDTTNEREIQLGIYAGYSFSADINNAHGSHGGFNPIVIIHTTGASEAQSNDVTVENIDIEQNFTIGINSRFYLTRNFDIEADLIYTKALFPEQEVILQGYTINQPKSDLNFFTISLGPGYRYKGSGTWQTVNPYVSAAFSVLLGYAGDVNFFPYGKGGYSFVSGIGFNAGIGTQFHLNKIVLSIEYRFEYLSSKVDQFRSFTEGLNFNKTASYILLGADYSF